MVFNQLAILSITHFSFSIKRTVSTNATYEKITHEGIESNKIWKVVKAQ